MESSVGGGGIPTEVGAQLSMLVACEPVYLLQELFSNKHPGYDPSAWLSPDLRLTCVQS